MLLYFKKILKFLIEILIFWLELQLLKYHFNHFYFQKQQNLEINYQITLFDLKNHQ